ncbi:MAG TPA: dehydrogenase [Verrucomicrobiales bacterium]|nr:dehydrogenase [Verrucomicrobiales bacterium]
MRMPVILLPLALLAGLLPAVSAPLAPPSRGETIVLLGNGLAERMQYYGHFETELYRRYPNANLTIRNMGFQGDTPGFRPRAGRPDPWAFPGAEKLRPEFPTHYGVGHQASPDEWLTLVKADTILAFFGFNESFDGPAGVEKFRGELAAFVKHTLAQKYNGKSTPKLALISPIAFQNLSASRDLPDGRMENQNLRIYTEVIRDVAAAHKVPFIDVFTPTKAWFDSTTTAFTVNGCHLTDAGYGKFAPMLADGIFGKPTTNPPPRTDLLRAAVQEKQWMWFNDYQVLNGVHVYGRRYKPFGNVNYPEETEKVRQMTALRDQKIWQVAQGEATSVAVDDSQTRPLSPIETNFKKEIVYLDGPQTLASFEMAPGYKIELFASSREFPELANPVQMSFDNHGRLWVSVLPGYPHYLPGGERPNDKILILEDTDNDGRADKISTFAEGLNLPIGFEIAHDGVYVSEEPNLIFLQDTDGDGRADTRTIIAGGFDSHDTHHAISAYTADGSGSFFMSEGRFLHSQVETPYGPQRCNDGGVWRFDPHSHRLERFAQIDVNNPWGVAFDEWGQNFVSDASDGANYWGLPVSVKMPYGVEIEKPAQFTTHRVRPTSGTEFVYSRHFPDEVQGDFLINNTIGFLGTKQHTVVEDGSGFTGELRHDLLRSTDPNFRPVDLEFAPDGSLYVVDWENALVGHMQHSARDPNRDTQHGRIFRVTYPARPLVKPAKIAGAAIPELLDNLKLPEYRTRYRTQRELRGRPTAEVLAAARDWAAGLDQNDPHFERHLLEALHVTWGHNQVDQKLLERCLNGRSHQLRAGAVRVLRYAHRRIDGATALFLKAANDPHPRVRLEALVAASWLDDQDGALIALEAMRQPIDKWMANAFKAAMVTLKDDADKLAADGFAGLGENDRARQFLAGKLDFTAAEKVEEAPILNLSKDELKLFEIGKEVYGRDAHCATCHQPDGKGLPNIYPAIIRNDWVLGDTDRLIKIVLKGLWGPIEVDGKKFDPKTGVPPMMGFAPLLNDEEIAGVLTYVRNSFGNRASAVKPEDVKRLREATKGRANFYMVDEILKEHPIKQEFRED